MGFSDVFSDFYNSIGFRELHAEAPPEEEKEEDEGGEDKGEEESDDGDKEEGGEEEGGDEEGGDEEEEEEEEEEDEPVDPKPKLEEGKSMASPHMYNEPGDWSWLQHPKISPTVSSAEAASLTSSLPETPAQTIVSPRPPVESFR